MSVIALDFETSGLNPYHDDIIEIGAKVMGEAPPAGSTTPMSCEDLAKRHKLPFDALRKRLERERAKNHGCYIEMGGSERRPRDPKYLYHQAKVQHIIDDMKDG